MLNKENPYYKQVALLIAVLPLVEEENCFALKGGTAINLFLHDMPRLSVDIDLTYLPIEDRINSLAAISAALIRIAKRIQDGVLGDNIFGETSQQFQQRQNVILESGERIKEGNGTLQDVDDLSNLLGSSEELF